MDNAARILYIIPNKFWGGGQQYIYELSKRIKKDKLGELYYIGRDVPICRQRFSELGLFLVLPLKSILDFYTIYRIGFFMWQKHITVVHAHIPKDAIIAILARQIFRLKCKIIMTRHLVRPGKFNLLYRWAYSHIDKFIFVSQTAQNDFFSTCPGKIHINNCIIYNSIKQGHHPTAFIELRNLYNIPASATIIGYAGRITYDKGPGVLIEAFVQASLPNTILVFVGNIEDNYSAILTELLNKCPVKDKIFFHPYMEDIYDFIRQTDIMVIPSIVKEACSLTLLECMLQAKAIITTNNGSQSEIVTDHKEALLVPPTDINALAQALQQLVKQPELRKLLGKNAAKKSKDYDYELFFEKMAEIYDITIAPSAPK